MRYLLDTNTCIAYLNGRSESVKNRLLSSEGEDLFLCSVVKAELTYGAMKSQRVETNMAKLHTFFDYFVSLPFGDREAEKYGEIRSVLEGQGKIIGPNDLMIASIASANDMILVTNNTKEFQRVEGLRIEDWL